MKLQKRTLILWTGILLAGAFLYACGQKEQGAESTETPKTTEMTQEGTGAGSQMGTPGGTAVALANPKPGIDPVCQMALGAEPVVVSHEGKNYGFCSQHCADTFKANPAPYLTASEDVHDDSHEGHQH